MTIASSRRSFLKFAAAAIAGAFIPQRKSYASVTRKLHGGGEKVSLEPIHLDPTVANVINASFTTPNQYLEQVNEALRWTWAPENRLILPEELPIA